jgi:hypothetical protein
MFSVNGKLNSTILRAHSFKTAAERRTAKIGCATKPSDEFEAGKEIGNFEGGGFGGVGAVSAIVADTGAEVVADGAGSCFLGVGGTHGVAPFKDGTFGFEDQNENFAGAHELAELAKKRASFMNGVKACGFAIRENHGLDGHDAEAGFVNAGENLALLAACDGIGFNDCESAFE